MNFYNTSWFFTKRYTKIFFLSISPISSFDSMKHDVEIMAEILPSVRAEIARELIFSYKLTQSDVSKVLGVSQPAVSQYVRQIRGTKVMYDGALRQQIKSLCEKLVNEKTQVDIENELYNIARFVVRSKTVKKGG